MVWLKVLWHVLFLWLHLVLSLLMAFLVASESRPVLGFALFAVAFTFFVARQFFDIYDRH